MRLVRAVAPAAAIVAFQVLVYPVPLGVTLQGIVLGLLNALVVAGLVLVHRANRVINLAQGSIGAFPAALAGGVVLFGAPTLATTVGMAAAGALVVWLGCVAILRLPVLTGLAVAVGAGVLGALSLVAGERLGWGGGLLVGLAAAALSGIAIDAIVIRRLRSSPRLVVTVATIGLAQLFAVGGLLVPRLWGQVALIDPDGDRTGFEAPLDWTVTIGSTVFGGAELIAIVVSLICLTAIGLGLRYTRLGMAVRAAADDGDRASMLGVPVPRIEASVWIVASVLAFLATYLQAGILGVEVSAGVGLRVMVAALAAMAVAGFSSLPAMGLAAVAIGVLTQASGPAGGYSLTLTDAVLAAVVLAGLLVRRRSSRRSDRDTTSSWQSVAEPRGLPHELAGLWLLRGAKVIALTMVVGALAVLPLVVGESTILRASTVIALAVITLSVVVVTGWTGEVSLGQMSFAAAGAAVAGVVTLEWRVDLTLALALAGAAGAAAAVLVALPALRWRGMVLAVTTLAFALAATNYLFNPTVAGWIPTDDVLRRPLLGQWDLASRHRMYAVALAVAVVCFAATAGIRRTRVGRILRAVRDNPETAQAFGVRVPLARVSAFALSGFLAGVGGGLLFAIHERYEVVMFGATESLNVFISAVVGGVGSMLGAVLGVALLDGSRGFLSGPAGLLPTAIGMLVVLLLLPGGLADLAYRIRDRALRAIATRLAIHVPSLVADSRVPDPAPRVGGDGGDNGELLSDDEEPGADRPVAEGPPGPLAPPQDRPVPAPATRATGATGGRDATGATSETGHLSIRGLGVAYNRVQILFDVDLDVRRGEITALLGTNGAGKSTLLRAIGGVAPVTAGTIHLDDVDLADLRPEEVPRHGVAQMPGGHGVFPSLTVEENLRVAAWLVRGRDARERTAEALARFPILETRRRSPAADLSGGQQQQLALAMALLARPKVLLVDELSLGLAPVVVAALLDDLRALRDEGTTIVIVEQSVNIALGVADHAYFMEKGEIRFSGPARDLLAQPELLRSVYLQGARDMLREAPAPAAPERDVEATPRHEPVPALEARGVTVRFGGISAVDQVDLEVASGEIVGLIGPNGAGKTTTFDLLSGLTTPAGGHIHLHGRDISSLPPSSRARLGMGRSFQDARLFAGLTVAETLSVAFERWIEADDVIGGAFRLPVTRHVERDIAAGVDELVEIFGLQAFRSKRIAELSTGSRRMVDLACLMAHRPSVVLLDEPSSGIAQREAEALGPVLLGLRDRLGASLLVIEHDTALIASVSDRLVALDLGAVVATGPPTEVLEHPAVVASYLGTGDETSRRSDQPAGRAR